jgi:hypothetical protein
VNKLFFVFEENGRNEKTNTKFEARDDGGTGSIEFGMKNLGLRIYIPGGKYKGIRARGTSA